MSIIENQDFITIKNRGGKTLGYDPQSGLKILIVDNLAFKDLNKNNELDDYEDWRLPVEDRAEDLAEKLTDKLRMTKEDLTTYLCNNLKSYSLEMWE